MDLTTVRPLEEIADRAWPAGETVRGDDWEARFSHGMHRRLNSATVWASSDIAGTVILLEDWYEERGHFPIFKLTDASAPGLDEYLADRGYVPDARVNIMTADLSERDRLGSTTGVGISTSPSDEWMDAFSDISAYEPHRRRLLAEILQRIGSSTAYATRRESEVIVSVGMAVAEGGHTGLFEMATRRNNVGCGFGTEILNSLLDWGCSQRAPTAYLQVLAGNEPAERLYRRAGFVPQYQYWYRVRPDWLSTIRR